MTDRTEATNIATVLALATYDRIAAEGAQSYANGEPITANPYLRGSEEWAAWREGYDK